MPRSRLAIGLAAPAIIVALAGLPAPAAAEGVLDVYGRLAKRDLPRAPLVLTRVPRELSPIGRTLGLSPSLRTQRVRTPPRERPAARGHRAERRRLRLDARGPPGHPPAPGFQRPPDAHTRPRRARP